MNKTKFLKENELDLFIDNKGNWIEGIKRITIQHTCPVILAEDKEELIDILNKKYKLDIVELLGIYRVEHTFGFFYIFYK